MRWNLLICSALAHAAFQRDAKKTRWIKRTASATVDIHKKLIELLHIEDIGGGQECAQTPSLPSELCVDDGASRDVPDALIHDALVIGAAMVGIEVRKPSLRMGEGCAAGKRPARRRSEEHTSELQSLMRISYAVFCLKKKN